MSASQSPVTDGSPPTPPATGTTRAGHQPEWQGNRCANCNAPLATAGPYCNVQKASIR